MREDKHPAWVKIEGARGLKDTDKAVQVEVAGDRSWIPRAVIHDDSECYKAGTDGDLIVQGWIAADREWSGTEYDPR